MVNSADCPADGPQHHSDALRADVGQVREVAATLPDVVAAAADRAVQTSARAPTRR
jgi:hypothetical protein